MRGPKSALIVGIVLVTAVSASMLRAQQGANSGSDSGTAKSSDDPPATMSRSARQLLRNGLDYLNHYQDYDRALEFFRDADARKGELGEPDRQQLAKGIERARRGLRDGHAAAKAGRTINRPGALARAPIDEPVRRASAEMTEPAEPPTLAMTPPSTTVAATPPTTPEMPAVAAAPTAPDPAPTPAPEPIPDLPVAQDKPATPPPAGPAPILLEAEPPAIDPAPMPSPPAVAELPAELPPPAIDPAKPSAGTDPAPPAAESAVVVVPPIRSNTPAVVTAPADPPETYAPPIRSAAARARQAAEAATPSNPQAPSSPPAIAEVPAAEAPIASPPPIAEPAPAASPSPQPVALPDPDALPPLPPPTSGRALREPLASPVAMSVVAGDGPAVDSTIHPDTLREVEEITRREMTIQRDNPRTSPLSTSTGNATGDTASASSKAFQLPRAPSPTEPRPIRAIPVPEEFVPLPKRQFDPNRKYWVAAATCHMPLYFQDAALERYGQGVEQAFGPAGRFLSYPLDDPTQTNQRNQLVQPMYSAGLFIVQFVTLPYNLVMDPPWEAEYDLGYYRPGDRVPRNTYYFPLTGVGPPLKGNDYGNPKPRKGWFLPILSH